MSSSSKQPIVKKPILQSIAACIGIAIACVVLYSGCLELEQSVAIRRDGTVTVTLGYVIDSTFAELGTVDGAPNARHISTIPINRQDFERLDALYRDISFNRYRKRFRNDRYRVNARLTFDTVDAFNRLFTISTPDAPTPSPSLHIEQGGSGGAMTLAFVGMPTTLGSDPVTTSESILLFAELDVFRRSSVTYTIRTPQPITSVEYPPTYPITVVRRIDTDITSQPHIQLVQNNRTLTLHAPLSSVMALPPQSTIQIVW